MRKLIAIVVTFGLCLGIAMTASAAGDAAKGKALFQYCQACHGANGEGNHTYNAPVIGGQEAWYIERQLKNFKGGIRGTDHRDVNGAQMLPMSRTMKDDESIANVAAYVASLKPPAPMATVQGDAAAGKASFAICVACHGANGEGNQALNAPKLAGQHDWYIQRQVKNFKAGVRGVNPKDVYGAQMRPMALTLATDDMISNVTAYIQSLNR
ncbi:MAG: c-type cytochrome [SAR324 cluster bacterium]|nr:c-type cytochrome [SAR324 cluster bacterium]